MNLIDTQELKSYSIHAKDGELGKIADFYFDEEFFILRYFVVNTESFLLRKLVLVSPISLHSIDKDNKVVNLTLTKKELQDSPPFDSVETVSRQYEEAYNDYFAWPYYWSSPHSAWAIGPYGVPWQYYDQMGRETERNEERKKTIKAAQENVLQSAKEVRSYAVEGVDEKFGHIQGFVIDAQTLAIEYIVVDTINYLPSKLVLLKPEWVENISWHHQSMSFPFLKDKITSAPAYKTGVFAHDLLLENDEHFSTEVKTTSTPTERRIQLF